MFLCLIAQDRILTSCSSWRQQLAVTPVCSICGNGSEDILHAIRNCRAAGDVWVRFIPLHLVGNFFLTGLREWLQTRFGKECYVAKDDGNYLLEHLEVEK